MVCLRDVLADTPRIHTSLLKGVKELERERRFLLDRQPPYPRWVVWGKSLCTIYIPVTIPVFSVGVTLMVLLPGHKMRLGCLFFCLIALLTIWASKADDFTWRIDILNHDERQALQEGLGSFALRRDVVSQFAASVEQLRIRVSYRYDKELLQKVEDLHREVLDLRDFAGDANCYRGMKLLSKHVPHYDGSIGNNDDARADHWYEELTLTFDKLTVLAKRAR